MTRFCAALMDCFDFSFRSYTEPSQMCTVSLSTLENDTLEKNP